MYRFGRIKAKKEATLPPFYKNISLYAVWDSTRVSEEDAWEHINLEDLD